MAVDFDLGTPGEASLAHRAVSRGSFGCQSSRLLDRPAHEIAPWNVANQEITPTVYVMYTIKIELRFYLEQLHETDT